MSEVKKEADASLEVAGYVHKERGMAKMRLVYHDGQSSDAECRAIKLMGKYLGYLCGAPPEPPVKSIEISDDETKKKHVFDGKELRPIKKDSEKIALAAFLLSEPIIPMVPLRDLAIVGDAIEALLSRVGERATVADEVDPGSGCICMGECYDPNMEAMVRKNGACLNIDCSVRGATGNLYRCVCKCAKQPMHFHAVKMFFCSLRCRRAWQRSKYNFMNIPEAAPLTGAQCGKCGKREDSETKFSKCGRCKNTSYCSKDCQNADWKEHKAACHSPTKKVHAEVHLIQADASYRPPYAAAVHYVNGEKKDCEVETGRLKDGTACLFIRVKPRQFRIKVITLTFNGKDLFGREFPGPGASTMVGNAVVLGLVFIKKDADFIKAEQIVSETNDKIHERYVEVDSLMVYSDENTVIHRTGQISTKVTLGSRA